jgi:hypothetical protein
MTENFLLYFGGSISFPYVMAFPTTGHPLAVYNPAKLNMTK